MITGLWVAGGAGLVASALAGVRWLRVAQREHYLASSSRRFALRWWGGVGINRAWWVLGAVAAVVALAEPPVVVVTAVVVGAGPFGLGLRGRTAKLVWTGRLRRLAAVWGLLQLAALAGAVVIGAGTGRAGVGAALVGVVVLGTPLLVDAACALAAPLERRLVAPFVSSAAERLRRFGPVVVAITGSYGKTSTKGYVAHLVGSARTVVPSPASYNNRAGLARAINEHLVAGTDVFVAEMGTYGKGEIAELCSWVRPTVAVITAIGPVHLERFGSEDRIVEAKSEILAGARVAVLNVDDDRLAALADRVQGEGLVVWRCSARDPGADVYVGREAGVSGDPGTDGAGGPSAGGSGGPGADGGGDGVADREADRIAGRAANRVAGRAADRVATAGLVVLARGRPVGSFTGVAGGAAAAPTNVACAVAVALELGVPPEEVGRRLASLPVTRNRLAALKGSGGFTILDDTYNANPAGARMAMGALARAEPAGDGHRRVLVTPGMVELGSRQADENEAFAAAARQVVTDLVVVGHTNRAALLAGVGAPTEHPQVVLTANRDQAVAWVREHLGPGDVVLYENDLPDHFP